MSKTENQICCNYCLDGWRYDKKAPKLYVEVFSETREKLRNGLSFSVH